MAYFHSNDFSTHENECGSCALMEVNNYKLRWYCQKYKCSYPISSSKCSSYVKDKSRDYDFWRKIYTYHVSTAVCQILDFDINSTLFQSIKKLRDEMEKDEKYKGLLTLYDIVGPYIADRMYKDPNNKHLCSCIATDCFPKIVLLINNNQITEAIKEYKNVVEKLYQYYQNVDASVHSINEVSCLQENQKVLNYKFLINKLGL